jgi:HlyD family secretion protein
MSFWSTLVRIFLIGFSLLFIVLAVVLVVFGTSGFGISGLMTFEPPSTEARMDTVKHGVLQEVVSAPGEVEPDTKVDISAEVSARIDALPLREGDLVSKGDLVVKLDDRDLKAALKSAQARRDAEYFRLKSEQASLAAPMARLETAKRQLERQKKLFETGDISRIALEDAQQSVDDLSAQVGAAQHSISVIESSLAASEADISRANEALGRTEIRAPMDGVVTALNAEVGELVMVGTMNNAATVILTVADLSSMHLDARVSESDIARVLRAQKAEIRINAYRDEVFDGDVTRIALQRTLDGSGAGYFMTEVHLNLRGRDIYSGLAANVDILVDDHVGLLVPSQAVLDRAIDDMPESVLVSSELVDMDRSAISVVYVVVDGKAICTPVRTGPSSLTETLILEGVAEGAEVIVGPYKVLETVKHDDPIRSMKGSITTSDDGNDQGNRIEVSF